MGNDKRLPSVGEVLSKPLRVEELEFREGRKSGEYTFIFAYKDARVDMQRLDAAVSPMGWQRRHELIDGNLHCHVGIRNTQTGEWVFKSDVGTPSQFEAAKGAASDAFKRACTNWGIGRELYDMKWLVTKADCSTMFKWVWSAEYDEQGLIKALAAHDRKGNQVAAFNRPKA